MRVSGRAILFLLALMLCGAAQPQTIRGIATGEVTSVRDSYGTGAFRVGDPVELSFTYDSSAPDERPEDPSSGSWLQWDNTWRLDIGEHEITSTDGAMPLILEYHERPTHGRGDSIRAQMSWDSAAWSDVLPVLDSDDWVAEPTTDWRFSDPSAGTLASDQLSDLAESVWRNGTMGISVPVEAFDDPDEPGIPSVGAWVRLDSLRFVRLGGFRVQSCAGIDPRRVRAGYSPVCRCLVDFAARSLGCRMRMPSFELERRTPWPIPVSEPFEVTWTVHEIDAPVADLRIVESLPDGIMSVEQAEEIELIFKRQPKDGGFDDERFTVVAEEGSPRRLGQVAIRWGEGQKSDSTVDVRTYYRLDLGDEQSN